VLDGLARADLPPPWLTTEGSICIADRAVWTLEVTRDGEPLGEPAEAMLEAPNLVGTSDPKRRARKCTLRGRRTSKVV